MPFLPVRVKFLEEGVELAWVGSIHTACVNTYNEGMACGDWGGEHVAFPDELAKGYKVRMRRTVDGHEATEIDAAAWVEPNIRLQEGG